MLLCALWPLLSSNRCVTASTTQREQALSSTRQPGLFHSMRSFTSRGSQPAIERLPYGAALPQIGQMTTCWLLPISIVILLAVIWFPIIYYARVMVYSFLFQSETLRVL